MPTYVYKRQDGSTFDLRQSIKDDALTVCPTTGQKIKRIIVSAPMVEFADDFMHSTYSMPGGDCTTWAKNGSELRG